MGKSVGDLIMKITLLFPNHSPRDIRRRQKLVPALRLYLPNDLLVALTGMDRLRKSGSINSSSKLADGRQVVKMMKKGKTSNVLKHPSQSTILVQLFWTLFVVLCWPTSRMLLPTNA